MPLPTREPSSRASERSGEMPIEDRNLEPGTVLTARYRKQEHTCEVVQTAEGLRYRLDDGTEHKSPSAAGKAVTGGACNGWVFWSVAGTEKPKREAKARADKPEKPAPAKKPAAKKSAKKPAKGKVKAIRAKDVPSYGCGGCGATFGSQKAAVAHAMTHTS
ncbi:MAG: DUF2924 domain-containing protein [Dehalococcoidia bacterium]